MLHWSTGLVRAWPEADAAVRVTVSVIAIAAVTGAVQGDGVISLGWGGTSSRCDEGCVIGCKLGCGRCCDWACFGSRLRDC